MDKYQTMSKAELEAEFEKLDKIGYDNFTEQQEYDYGMIATLLLSDESDEDEVTQ